MKQSEYIIIILLIAVATSFSVNFIQYLTINRLNGHKKLLYENIKLSNDIIEIQDSTISKLKMEIKYYKNIYPITKDLNK